MGLPHNRWFNRAGNWLPIGLIALIMVWVYFPTLHGLWRVWETDPNYNQGFLIPVLALGLLVYRCRQEPPEPRPDPRGLGLLALATVMRGAAAYFYVTPLDHLSLLVALTGLGLTLGGRPWLRRAWPAIALLVFMFPVPASLGGSELAGRLQTLATVSSTFALETLGVTAARDGNVILLRTTELGVVEACSGLKMLMVFCALAAVTAFLVPAGWVRKVILVASAVPLALLCNVIRITITGAASEALETKTGYFLFHDFPGIMMVPLAFLMLGAEVFLLSKLFRIEAPANHEVTLRVLGAPRAAEPVSA
ncbi:exosortase/archaeosortase family protein [Frigoriglobus tundricola]|uniref:Eight transmembrane protein EpsH n=1 Tax=Frigoriglobus tundricola TaxID=2774151 RepID=A0A6M5Z054_9BACT|nr:exosortase/archaeosortase family protein [Frigoriglobus tundricola]QJW99689.1 hypothetical protein FTUN_7310 [Frigoriglobus tundricola]